VNDFKDPPLPQDRLGWILPAQETVRGPLSTSTVRPGHRLRLWSPVRKTSAFDTIALARCMASGARKLCLARSSVAVSIVGGDVDDLQRFAREESLEALKEIGVALTERLDAALEARETGRDHGVLRGLRAFDPREAPLSGIQARPRCCR
jgi:hypothetical protein